MMTNRSDRGRRRGSFELHIADTRLTFRTQAGVFSQDGPDEGSMLLLETVLPQIKPHQTVLDLGSGVGLLGLSIAPLLTRGEVWLADSDIRAVRLTQENIELNDIKNAHAVLSDITLDLPPMKFDLVLSNPPTHSGKEVLASFVAESYAALRPGGRLYIVVNRLLSIRDVMDETFGSAERVSRREGFIIFRAQKPRRAHVQHADARLR